MSFKGLKLELERQMIKGQVDWGNFPVEQRSRWERRWLDDMADSNSPKFSEDGRRLNQFCVGSDPEFVFVAAGSRSKTNAVDLGLRPALAAGCDQNQRLAELRGWPTQSVVEHVAGLLASLRWMYRTYPNVRDYNWRAGAYHSNDGIGGHVHFGRKRPTRNEEVGALDGITAAIRQLEIFNWAEWSRRISGDTHNQRYGDFGDIRPQVHGYEYRTMPSWLSSPTQAFFILTLSKLAVLDPDLCSNWRQLLTNREQSLLAIKRLVRYYAGRDDDAWLLKSMLAANTRPIGFRFGETTNDFKANWGFNPLLMSGVTENRGLIPACIKPTKEEVSEVERSLMTRTPLAYKEYAPTFKQEIPSGYVWRYRNAVSRMEWAGVGDLYHDLVGYEKDPVEIQVSNSGAEFVISQDLFKRWSFKQQQDVRRLFSENRLRITYTMQPLIQFERSMLTVPTIRKCRTFLLRMGLFPLWTVDKVTKNSYPEWLETFKGSKIKKAVAEERTL